MPSVLLPVCVTACSATSSKSPSSLTQTLSKVMGSAMLSTCKLWGSIVEYGGSHTFCLIPAHSIVKLLIWASWQCASQICSCSVCMRRNRLWVHTILYRIMYICCSLFLSGICCSLCLHGVMWCFGNSWGLWHLVKAGDAQCRKWCLGLFTNPHDSLQSSDSNL